MKSEKILHLVFLDKFIPPFVDILEEQSYFFDHIFYVRGDESRYPIRARRNILFWRDYDGGVSALTELIRELNRAKKIVIHGLFDFRTLLLLFVQPWLLKKCYWVLWGGDLYTYALGEKNWKWWVKEVIRKPVIKNLRCITTTVPGDFLLAKKWYKTNASYIENIMYPSHLCRKINLGYLGVEKGKINIQIGNSADPSNNHAEIIDSICDFNLSSTNVFCPLSYGDEKYRDEVIRYGRLKLGDKFIPITDFMDFNRYTEYMGRIDIAIFNHKRQQAMGNIIGMLSLGKKIYIRPEITPFPYFREKGFVIYSSMDGISLDRISASDAANNIKLAESHFTEERMLASWERVFND